MYGTSCTHGDLNASNRVAEMWPPVNWATWPWGPLEVGPALCQGRGARAWACCRQAARLLPCLSCWGCSSIDLYDPWYISMAPNLFLKYFCKIFHSFLRKFYHVLCYFFLTQIQTYRNRIVPRNNVHTLNQTHQALRFPPFSLTVTAYFFFFWNT